MAAGRKRMNALIAAPMVLPTPSNRVLKAARRSLERLIDRMIDQADGPDGQGRGFLLDRLLDDHGARERVARTAQFYAEIAAPSASARVSVDRCRADPFRPA